MLPSVATSTADSGFIAMIRTGVLALQLLPRNSSLKIGKTQFQFKILPLDGKHLKVTLTFFFLAKMAPSLMVVSKIVKINKESCGDSGTPGGQIMH